MNDRDLLEMLVEKIVGMELEFKEMRTEIKADVTDLKQDVMDLKKDVMDLNSKLSNIEYRQNIIYEQTSFLTEYRTENEYKILDLYRKVEHNTTDIQVIKKALAK